MNYMLHFEHSLALYFLVPLLCFIAWMRFKFHKGVYYSYPLASFFAVKGLVSTHPHKKIIALLRLSQLCLLIILIAKPQWVDPRSTVTIKGIDMVLVLDVSGSMANPHHTDDSRTRIDVAKEEAIRFIGKRVNDAIGIVIFGNDAVSRCPLTVDKKMLKETVEDVSIGIIDPEGTLLAKAIITAANRLKQSKSASKIMILLTDGEPSENDSDPAQAIEVARRMGIKIYTIGIGDNQELLMRHPLFGAIPLKTTLNKPLLMKIAHETGGTFFEAKNAQDMRKVYDAIDALEKTEITAPIFTNYYDWFMPLLWIVAVLIVLEIVLTTFVWFSI